jgi:hypothetical protein
MMSYQLRDLSLPGVWSTLVKQGHFSRKYPVLALKSWTVLDFLGICSYFMDLKGVFDLPSIYYGSDHDL